MTNPSMQWVFSTFGKHPIPGSQNETRDQDLEPSSRSTVDPQEHLILQRNEPDENGTMDAPMQHEDQQMAEGGSRRASAGSSTLHTRHTRAQTAESIYSFGHNLHSFGEVAAPAPANFYTNDVVQSRRRSQSLDFVLDDAQSRMSQIDWPLPDGLMTVNSGVGASAVREQVSKASVAEIVANASYEEKVGHGRSMSNSGQKRSASLRKRSGHDLRRRSSERMRASMERLRQSQEHLRNGSKQEQTLSTNYEDLEETTTPSTPVNQKEPHVMGVPSLHRSRSQSLSRYRTTNHDTADSPRAESWRAAEYYFPVSLESLSEVVDELPIDELVEKRIARRISLDQRQAGIPRLVQKRKSSLKASTMTNNGTNFHDVNPERFKARAEMKRPLELRKSPQALPRPRATSRPSPSSRSRDSEATALPRFLYDQSNLEEQLEAARMMQDVFLSPTPASDDEKKTTSRFVIELYTISYLLFFSIWGTLARLGLQALTFYPGAPVATSVLWPNFAGCLILGFLVEVGRVWRRKRESYTLEIPPLNPDAPSASMKEKMQAHTRRTGPDDDGKSHQLTGHARVSDPMPVYIGLTTGFCGCFTNFAAFMRDVFLALSNDLPSPLNHPYPAGTVLPAATSTISRNVGYSIMAGIAVVFLTVFICLAGVKLGAHAAAAVHARLPILNLNFTRRILDPVFVILGWGCWVGAIVLTIWPPDRHSTPSSSSSSHPTTSWRSQALFALVFAPPGCLLRHYITTSHLNRLASSTFTPTSFPLGTFATIIFGTAVAGMAFDLQHLGLGSAGLVGGGHLSCQVLQGLQEGFCACLAALAPWIAEVDGLLRSSGGIEAEGLWRGCVGGEEEEEGMVGTAKVRRGTKARGSKGAGYVYAIASIVAGIAVSLAIMGSVRWTFGWTEPLCAA